MVVYPFTHGSTSVGLRSNQRINGLVFAEGRLRLMTSDRKRLISDSFYLHVYRRRDGHWEMIEGASTPVPQSSQ